MCNFTLAVPVEHSQKLIYCNDRRDNCDSVQCMCGTREDVRQASLKVAISEVKTFLSPFVLVLFFSNYFIKLLNFHFYFFLVLVNLSSETLFLTPMVKVSR